MASPRIPDALSRLAAAEEQFLASEFLAPVVRGGMVQVRIAGVVCRLSITPRAFEGWGVFRPTSHKAARLVRQATLSERQRYLELLPRVWLILCGREQSRWLAILAHQGDVRFRINGIVLVRLVEEAELFDVVVTRFDGAQFWYEGADDRSDPGAAAYLRKALESLTEPLALDRPGLTVEQRTAYALQYTPRQEEVQASARDPNEARLRQALDRAGAGFLSYQDRADVYTVTYEVDGRQHVAAVAQGDLTVQAAGICLSGQDANFDLQSLVGVLRQYHDV
jgi:hypothetical protein